MTTKTDIIVIRIIKRRVLGKVIPTKSIPPLIQEGAVTSTFLALARLSLLTKEAKTPPVATPNKAEKPQVEALINLPFAPLSKSSEINNGANKPKKSAITSPLP